MKRTKELFEEQRESEPIDEATVRRINEEMLWPEETFKPDPLPVIDLNTIQPEEKGTLMNLGGESLELVDNTAFQLAQRLITNIMNGEVDPLVFMVKKKLLEQALTVAAKDPNVKVMVENEVAKYGKEGAKIMGATITAGYRKKYMYAEDPIWKNLSDSIAPTQAKIKDQEKKIQDAVRAGGPVINKETGEVLVECVSAPTTNFVAVSFKAKKPS
jgi:hypothetical protein